MAVSHKLVLWVSILASIVAFLDGSIVNVALPAISSELGGGLALQQWTVNAYLITLGALILIAGSLSDLFGRKKILEIGLIGFGITSVACALAPTGELLVVARALQGAAGALLVPSSLALITSAFSGPAQAKAIGSWTAWTGMAFIIGPLLGGFLVDIGSWRWAFGINVLPIAVTLWLLSRIDVKHDRKAGAKVDVMGATLCALGLGGPVFALIEQPVRGWSDPIVWLPLTVGVVLLAAFVWYEKHAKHPMLPLELFKIRNFSAGNVATLFIYAAISAITFLAAVFLQQVSGYSAFMTGLALMPVTVVMFFLSSVFGGLAGKYGPRWFMAGGPLVIAIAYLLMLRFDVQTDVWLDVLPAILLFGLGLSITVAPLTAAVLGAIDSKHAGIASAINNAVARVAGLLAVAAIGAVLAMQFSGHLQQGLAARNISLPQAAAKELEGASLQVSPPSSVPGPMRPAVQEAQAQASVAAFRTSVMVMAGLTALGGLASAIGIRNNAKPTAVAGPRSRS
jgi:EmrB/QacA subfamily drug resistance transporter